MTVLNEFYQLLSSEDEEVYKAIADYAYELGYKAKRAKTKDINYVFINNKTKKHLLKFAYNNKVKKPELKVKFYATLDYSHLFHQGIKNEIEAFDFKYTGCYKCGRCEGSPEGYIYEYPDGKKYFRCGHELICLPAINRGNINEIIKLLRIQHEYYMSRLQ